MIPGIVSKLTEKITSIPAATATIRAEADIMRTVGAGPLTTVLPMSPDHSQFMILVTDTAVVLGTGGNILVGITTVINRPLFMLFSKSLQKWLINSGV